jgi:hypothetical protein
VSTETIIDITLLDERTLRVTTRSFMCAADRVAFERHFQISSTELMRASAAAKALGELTSASDGAEDGALEAATAAVGDQAGGLRETWMLFFCWRAATRGAAEALGSMSFEDFCEQVADYDITEGNEPAAADPTEPVPRIA